MGDVPDDLLRDLDEGKAYLQINMGSTGDAVLVANVSRQFKIITGRQKFTYIIFLVLLKKIFFLCFFFFFFLVGLGFWGNLF